MSIRNSLSIYDRRLLKLADHLISGKLGHKVFDFALFNGGFNSGVDWSKPNICGTNGCAIGELPVVWPKIFKWQFTDQPTGTNIVKWFDINKEEHDYLFFPTDRKNSLPKNATKEAVAGRIYHFVLSGRRMVGYDETTD
jgi:hypothetical protein